VEITDKKYQSGRGRRYVDYFSLFPRYWHEAEERVYVPRWPKKVPEGRVAPGVHEGYHYRYLLPDMHGRICRYGPTDKTEKHMMMMNKVGIDDFVWLVVGRKQESFAGEETVGWPMNVRLYETLAFLTVLGWRELVDPDRVYRPEPLASFDGYLLWAAAHGAEVEPSEWLALYNSAASENLFMYSEPMYVDASHPRHVDYMNYLTALDEGGYALRPEALTPYLYMNLMRSRFFIDSFHAFTLLDTLRRRGLVRYESGRILPEMEPEGGVAPGELLADYAWRLRKNEVPAVPTEDMAYFVRGVARIRFPLKCGKCGGDARQEGRSVWCLGCRRAAHFPQEDPFWMAAAFASGRTMVRDPNTGRRREVVLLNEKKGVELCQYV